MCGEINAEERVGEQPININKHQVYSQRAVNDLLLPFISALITMFKPVICNVRTTSLKMVATSQVNLFNPTDPLARSIKLMQFCFIF